MPNLFDYLGYTVYFWSNENYEPIHVHISKGNPKASSTKVWLTKSGRCIVAYNKNQIPQNELRKILKSIEANFFYIVSKWKQFYGEDNTKFYC